MSHSPRPRRASSADEADRFGNSEMRYTPEQLKRTPTDKLPAELPAKFADLEVIGSGRRLWDTRRAA